MHTSTAAQRAQNTSKLRRDLHYLTTLNRQMTSQMTSRRQKEPETPDPQVSVHHFLDASACQIDEESLTFVFSNYHIVINIVTIPTLSFLSLEGALVVCPLIKCASTSVHRRHMWSHFLSTLKAFQTVSASLNDFNHPGADTNRTFIFHGGLLRPVAPK